MGDINFCYQSTTSNSTKRLLTSLNFKQLIETPTHIEGNLLDHAYIRDENQILGVTAELHSKYYSDHKALAIMIKKGKKYYKQWQSLCYHFSGNERELANMTVNDVIS